MNDLTERLNECLEALREGRWDIEECLRRYPQHAAQLRPQLVAAQSLLRAYGGLPREEFARSARERFLIASGQRLKEVYEVEPEPSFFATARVRFLMVAHRMRAAEAQPRTRRVPPLVPLVERHFRTFASAAAVLVLFLSFSTYTVASANSALPGDWQYPVKLQTERIRLALALTEGDKRGVKLDIAEARAGELEKLTHRGKIIGPGVLDRLVEQTQPLVQSAGESWDTGDVARLQEIASREKRALESAKPQVDPSAEDNLAKAVDVSNAGLLVSSKIIVQRPEAPPEVVTPSELLTATPDASATAAPTETAAAAGASTPGPAPTSAATTPQGAPTAGLPPFVVGPTPEIERGGVEWRRLVAGRLTTLIPDESNGWRYNFDVADGPNPVVALIHLTNADGTSLITLNPRNGDMYWFDAHGGRFGEIQMRLQQDDGTIRVIDRGYLQTVYGDDATIPLYVLDHIELQPLPTPTVEPEPPQKFTPTPGTP